MVAVLNGLMGLPPVVVGLLVYLLLSRAGPLGSLGLLFTPTAMIVAQTVLITPIIAALARQVIEDAWREYEEQLRSLGARLPDTVWTLIWDTRFSLVTVILAGLGRAAAEVGAVMIVGGNVGITRVMTTAIALETSKGDLPLALALGIVLIGIVLLLNVMAYAVKETAQRRRTDDLHARPRIDLPLVLEHVRFAAGGNAIINDVSLELRAGSCTVILGPNGAGKSVLLLPLPRMCCSRQPER